MWILILDTFQAFKIEVDESEIKKLDPREARDILQVELTKCEFGDAMGLKPNSVFVDNMFNLIDKDSNGYVSFREFMDMIIIFAKGMILVYLIVLVHLSQNTGISWYS